MPPSSRGEALKQIFLSDFRGYLPLMITLISGLFYVDAWIIKNLFYSFSVDEVHLIFFLGSFVGTAKLLYSYLFLEWFDENQRIQFLFSLGTWYLAPRREDRWLMTKVKKLIRWTIRKLKRRATPRQFENKRLFYLWILAIGFLPKPGARTVALIQCRNRRSILALFCLCLGNMTRFACWCYFPTFLSALF